MFGVGVKFGPALGGYASAHILGNDVQQGTMSLHPVIVV